MCYCLYVTYLYRAGVRHIRGVRPNRAADFRGPPILPDSGRRQMQCFCMFVRSSDSVVRHLVVLDSLTNTHDYWLITNVQYCTVYESMWRSGLRSEPRWGAYSALQSPDPRKTHIWSAKLCEMVNNSAADCSVMLCVDCCHQHGDESILGIPMGPTRIPREWESLS